MFGDREVAAEGQPINSAFLNWGSASVVNPKNGFHFCDRWFFTSVTRGRPMDVAIQPLNPEPDSGFRLLMRDPPEQVRVWHRLPDDLFDGRRKFVKVRLRGISQAADTVQLDSMALFVGDEASRKIDRRLIGAIVLNESWHEFTTELRGSGAAMEGARYLSLRFSGKGTIELEFCRLEATPGKLGAWPAAKSIAAKVLSGLRQTVPVASTPAASAELDDKESESFVAAPPVPAPAKPEKVSAPVAAQTLAKSEPEAKRRPGAVSERQKSVAKLKPEERTQGAPDSVVAASSPVRARVEADKVSAPPAEPDAPGSKPEERPGSSAVSEQWQKGPNFLQNSDFLSWSESGPAHWTAILPEGASIRRGRLSADRPFKSGGLVLAADKMRPDRTMSLSQGMAGRLKPKQILNFAIVGSADARTEVEITLKTMSSADIAATDTVVLGAKWQFRTARIVVPANFSDDGGVVAVSIRGGQAKVVNLAFVSAGAPGEDIAGQLEVHELADRDSNALANGKFDHWSGPLRRPLSIRRTEITDDWVLINKTPSLGVEARLTEIVPRGLRDGGEHEAVAGLALYGELKGSYVRMEASLDVLQIASGPPRRLRFYARTAAPSSAEASAQRDRSVVQQIFVAERRRVTPTSSEFEVTRLFTIRRNLRIARIGELHAIDLRADHRATLLSKAREMMHDVDRSLLLIFECSGFADVAIGDVYFGNDVGVEEEEGGTNTAGEAVLEDPNIAAQVAYLKGIAHWQSPLAIAANSNHVDARPAAQANWTWLPDSKFTLDIAICVYNAVEETLDCLESLQRHTTVPHTVTIIDDKSSEATRERLRLYVAGKPWIRLIENPKNLGYTRSANIGLSSSSAEWVILLNSDTIVTPGWVEGLFEVVKARPRVAMVGPLSNAASWQSVPDLQDVKGGWSVNPIPEGFSVVDVAQLVADLSPKEFPEATLLNGFCTLMRRDVIEQVGYLDEAAFPMGYGEENDLCLRVRKAGYSLAVADHVYVYHVKSASFGSVRRSELSKRGTAQLHLKHPDVDMKEIQREMAELTSLITLRKKLRQRFGSAAFLKGRTAEQVRGAASGSSLTH